MAHQAFPWHSLPPAPKFCSNPAPVQPVWSWWDVGQEDQLPSLQKALRAPWKASAGIQHFHHARFNSTPHLGSLHSSSLQRTVPKSARVREGLEMDHNWEPSPSTLLTKKLRISGKDPRSWQHTKPGFAKAEPKSFSARKGQHSRARGKQQLLDKTL